MMLHNGSKDFMKLNFNVFFEYNRSARFQKILLLILNCPYKICTSFIVAVLGFNPVQGIIKFTVAAMSEQLTESADNVHVTLPCSSMLKEAGFSSL